MLDIRRIRNEPDAIKRNLAKRGENTAQVDALLAIDETRRMKQGEWDGLRAEQKKLGSQVEAAKRAGQDAGPLLARSGEMKGRLQRLDEELKSLDSEQHALLGALPNLVLDDVPAGGEESNTEIRQPTRPLRTFDFEPRAHWELGASLRLFSTELGTRLAGSGFVLYSGIGARLQRALGNLMLDMHTTKHGYTELGVPYLLSRESVTVSGHIVRFSPEMYHDSLSDLFFIPTAEPALVNVHRGELLDLQTLPLKYVAHTPCWRREAGAAGKDTRGLQRVHQFDKVEIFQVTLPEASHAAQAEMIEHASAVLDALEIPYRLLLLAAGDTGFSMARTVDIEAWAPGLQKWLEVSSASNGTDFQARRADIRFRREANVKSEFPHMLNASGTALARVYAALLENHQNVDGTVTVPHALRPYLGGIEVLS